ncbi:ABC transporter permease [Agaricicola taiwanensis]|uniref:ABC transporter permease n=2 Tax=Agaricicola taiwanensis TaxID=591372 RepID=A0A8J2YHM1_9RHOB|nr:ABC transporter permease [Agaricicola taiwanensis]
MTDGLASEGRVLLGGDLEFELNHQEATPEQRAFLESRGTVSRVASIRAMARGGNGEATLSELKAVDGAYPLVGAVETNPPVAIEDALSEQNGSFGVLAAPALLDRLGIETGARIRIGNAEYEVRATLAKEPDAIAGGIDFGPRILMSDAGLAASGLIQPGSLVEWSYRLALPEGASDDAIRTTREAVSSAFPDAGWRIRDRQNVSPRLERNIERFTQFLTLVGLTALMVGGVGVVNAVGGFVDRKRETIASLKCLGASGGFVVLVHLVQIMALALVGVVIGLVLGAAMPFAVAWGLGAMIPVPFTPSVDGLNLALGASYGLLTALAFALWPLGRAHDVAVSALFRERIGGVKGLPRLRYRLTGALALTALVALAIAAAYDRYIAILFVGAAAAIFLGLRLIASLITWAARKLPRPRQTELRLALTNIHRPGALTPSVVLSLGLGLSLMVTVVLIEGSLRRQLTGNLPEMAPSFFFLDVANTDGDRFETFLRERGADPQIERVPMLRGRVVSLKGIAAAEYPTTPESEWVLRGDRGITFSSAPPEGSTVTEGSWWPADYDGPPQVSFGAELARELQLSIGDEVQVNVLGRTITARIANLRDIQWERLGINFVMVFSPNAFRGAPYTYLATLSYPDGAGAEQERGLLRAVADAFPNVTAVRVKEALDTVNALVGDLALAIRSASGVTLVSSILVLAGALAAGHRHRVYDAVVLKTLGATRKRLLAAFSLEYLMLGATTALFGVLAGSVAAYAVVTQVMNLAFFPDITGAAIAAFAALLLTVFLGLVGTWRILGETPARHLRNL